MPKKSNVLFPPNLTTDKQIYTIDDTITFFYQNILSAEKNWIGLWRFDDGAALGNMSYYTGPWEQQAGTYSNSWKYIQNIQGTTSGSLALATRDLAPGRYGVFLLASNEYLWLGQPIIIDIMDKSDKHALKVLTFNIWQEGTSVPNGFEGIVDEIAASNADLVALAEVRNYGNTILTERVVKALAQYGLRYYSYRSGVDVGIISRFPIKEHHDLGAFTKAIIKVNNLEIAFYSGHLDYTHYACYLPRGYQPSGGTHLPDGPETDVNAVLAVNDASKRPQEIEEFIQDAKVEHQKKRIVIMAGDFNEPSCLDWVKETKTLFDHNGAVIPWTTTKKLIDAGLQDAYRTLYPDPVTHPGFTWVSDNPAKEPGQLTWAPDADERDRIDFIFYYPDERMAPKDAVIVGPKSSIVKNKRVQETSQDKFKTPENVWPSDHKALLVQFEINGNK